MTIATEHKGAPVCPHCGDEADGDEALEDRETYDGAERKWRCAVCKEKFVITAHLTIAYSTRKT